MGRTSQRSWVTVRRAALRQAHERGQTTCAICGTHLDYETHGRPNSVEVDHIIPHSRGGRDVLENTQVVCRTCNRRKGNRTGFRMPIPQRIQPETAVNW